MNKPLIHDVISTENKSIPLFGNKFLDFFTRVKWYVPLIIFVPVIALLLLKHIQVAPVSFAFTVLLVVGGLVFWTISEYLIHRFVFHYEPKTEKMREIFFTFHGVHHAYPNDSLRLVMPPMMSIPLAIVFIYIFYLVLHQWAFAFGAGFFIGYLAYDMLHYATHHSRSKNRFFKKLKEHHMLHHHKHPNKGFGVTSDFWDMAFRTKFED